MPSSRSARFGHSTGDAVLIEAATRLTNCAGGEGLVARLRGGEFALLADGLARTDAQTLALRLRNAVIPPVKWKTARPE